MTIPMGARVKKINLSTVILTFEENGYTVLNDKEIEK